MSGAWSKCGLCSEEFAGVGPFDAHQRLDYDNKNPAQFVTCLPPAKIGLTINEDGYWGGMENVITVRQTHNQVLECAKCGKIWERPPQTGRLPKLCPKCKDK